MSMSTAATRSEATSCLFSLTYGHVYVLAGLRGILMFMYSLFRFTRRMKTGPVLNSPPAWTSNPFSGLRAQQRRLQWSNTQPALKRCVCFSALVKKHDRYTLKHGEEIKKICAFAFTNRRLSSLAKLFGVTSLMLISTHLHFLLVCYVLCCKNYCIVWETVCGIVLSKISIFR